MYISNGIFCCIVHLRIFVGILGVVYLFNLHAIFYFYANYFELTANDVHTQCTIEIELQNLFVSQSLQTKKKKTLKLKLMELNID